eukprot:SM000003S11118  [mRNA]  locus=s3:1018605:1021447:- [translate_table: standard]
MAARRAPAAATLWKFGPPVGLALVAALLLAGARAEDDGDAPGTNEHRRFCIASQQEFATCLQMTKILQSLDNDTEHTWSCVQGDGDDDCIQKVGNGDAEYTILDGGEIFDAYEDFGMIPILKEKLPGNGVLYFGVAIVHADECKSDMTLADLKGWSSCHTGYHRASGWYLPVSYMTGGNPPIMPIVNNNGSEEVDIQSVEAFFATSCAAVEDVYKAGDSFVEVCSGCTVKQNCDSTDTFYDYDGSFRCMVEGGSKHVSFTKHTIPIDYSKGGPQADLSWTNLETADKYKLVCPTGGCADVTAYSTCNLGGVVAHALMVAPNAAEDEINEFLDVMDKLNTNTEAKALLWSGKNTAGYIFSPDATGTERIPNGTNAISYIGSLYDAIVKIRTLDSTPVTAGPPPSSAAGMAVSMVVAFTALIAATLMAL